MAKKRRKFRNVRGSLGNPHGVKSDGTPVFVSVENSLAYKKMIEDELVKHGLLKEEERSITDDMIQSELAKGE